MKTTPSSDVPAELGSYRLVERIGVGGMGAVWRAERSGEGGFVKRVALKLMLEADVAADSVLRDRFLREARVAALLAHPNIVGVLDFAVDPRPYIVMELVEGVSLAALLSRLIARRERLDALAAAHIAAEVATGLEHAHAARDPAGAPLAIVHRDVSPQNILVADSGAVKVTDFGVVKAVDARFRTVVGTALGKPGYMAPEQIRGDEVDARSDVFALGVVLWELLALERLMPGGDLIGNLRRIEAGELLPPSSRVSSVPAELDELVMQMLAPSPNARPSHARWVAASAHRFVQGRAPGFGATEIARILASVFPERGRPSTPEPPQRTAVQPTVVERPDVATVLDASVQPTQQGRVPPTRALAPPRAQPQGSDVDATRAAQSSAETVVTPSASPRRIGRWLVVTGALAVVIALTALAVGQLVIAARRPAVAEAPSVPAARLRIDTIPVSATLYVAGQPVGTTPTFVNAEVTRDGAALLLLASGFAPRPLTPDELSRGFAAGAWSVAMQRVTAGSAFGAAYVRGGEWRETAQDPVTRESVVVPGYVAIPFALDGRPLIEAVVLSDPLGRVLGRLGVVDCGVWSMCRLGPILSPDPAR